MDRPGKKAVVILLALILLDGCLHTLLSGLTPSLSALSFLFSFLLHNGILLLWGVSADRRLLPSASQRQLRLSVILMLLWILLRAVRYRLTLAGSPLYLPLWYAYYIPQILLPLSFFFAALYIGYPDLREQSPAWRLLYIPAFLLIAGILTNDMHQLAFVFAPDYDPVTHDVYSYGPLYYAAAVWSAALIFAALILIRKRAGDSSRRQPWLPFVWPVLYILYIALFLFREPPFGLPRPFQYPEASCYTMLAIWETCIEKRLIPSNTEYDFFFSRAAIPAVITTAGGREVYRSACAAALPPEKKEEARIAPVMLGRDTRLSCHEIRGGYVYWTDDLSDLNRANAKLSSAAQTLSEETDLLAAENRLRREQAHIREQSEIYTSINRALRPELDALGALLDKTDPSAPDLRQSLGAICVRGAYVKRRANLMLLAAGSSGIPAAELALCVSESLTYLRLCGADCTLTGSLSGTLPADDALLLYDLFQWTAELSLPRPRYILVRLAQSGGVSLRVVLEADDLTNAPVWDDARAEQDGVTLRTETEDGCLYITLLLPEGGGGT